MKTGIAGLALAALALNTQADIVWTDWTSGTPGGNTAVAHGTLDIGGQTIGVTYTGHFFAMQTGAPGEFNYWAAHPATYDAPPLVPNIPGTSDIIHLNDAGVVNTITFSQAVLNPVMALISVGQWGNSVTYDFADGLTPTILSSGGSHWGWGYLENVGSNDVRGTEGSGTIGFLGSPVTSISWVNNPNEYWHGFTVGAEGVAPPAAVPEPGTLALMGLGLAGLAFAARRRKS